MQKQRTLPARGWGSAREASGGTAEGGGASGGGEGTGGEACPPFRWETPLRVKSPSNPRRGYLWGWLPLGPRSPSLARCGLRRKDDRRLSQWWGQGFPERSHLAWELPWGPALQLLLRPGSPGNGPLCPARRPAAAEGDRARGPCALEGAGGHPPPGASAAVFVGNIWLRGSSQPQLRGAGKLGPHTDLPSRGQEGGEGLRFPLPSPEVRGALWPCLQRCPSHGAGSHGHRQPGPAQTEGCSRSGVRGLQQVVEQAGGLLETRQW